MSDSLFTPSVYLRELFLTMLTLRFLEDHQYLMSGGLICWYTLYTSTDHSCIVTLINSILIHLVVADIVCIWNKTYRTSLSKSRKRNIPKSKTTLTDRSESIVWTLLCISHLYILINFVALILWINTSKKRPQRLVIFANIPDTFELNKFSVIFFFPPSDHLKVILNWNEI